MTTVGRVHGSAALAAALAFLLFPGKARAQDITVGFQTSLSGAISSIGIPQQNGILAGYALVSEVEGHKINLVKLDDASDPSAAARNARKLVDDYKADVIIGAAGSPLTIAIAGVTYEEKVPMIAVSPIALPGPRGDWLIIVPQPPDLMVEADIEHMKATGIKTVGFIGYNDAWGDQVYDSLKKLAPPAGIRIVADERYARPDTSVTAQILKLMEKEPDAVLEGGSGTPGALPHIALAERGYRGAQYATHAVIGPDFIRVGGDAVDGVIAPTGPVIVAEQLPATNPIRAVAVKFHAILEKVNGGPENDSSSAYAYDAWLILVDAAKRALPKAAPGTPEFRKALRDALITTTNVVGTHAIYNFKPGERYGVDARARVMVRLEHGQWTLMP